MTQPPPGSTLFPYTTLFRSGFARSGDPRLCRRKFLRWPASAVRGGRADADRKSTRLNSSHVAISYAVFCLKKKKKKAMEAWHGVSDLDYVGRRRNTVLDGWE